MTVTDKKRMMVINKNALRWSVIMVINFQFCSKAVTGWQRRGSGRTMFVSSRVHISISCFINSIPTKGSFWIAQSSCHKALLLTWRPQSIPDHNYVPLAISWLGHKYLSWLGTFLRLCWPGSWSVGAAQCSDQGACPGTGHSTGRRGRAPGRRVSASSGL